MHLYITELGLFAQLSPNYKCCESNTLLLHLIMKIIPFSPVVQLQSLKKLIYEWQLVCKGWDGNGDEETKLVMCKTYITTTSFYKMKHCCNCRGNTRLKIP